MSDMQMQALKLIKDIPEEKCGAILSFIEFIKATDQPCLQLEPDDEREIMDILRHNEWCSQEDMVRMLESNACE